MLSGSFIWREKEMEYTYSVTVKSSVAKPEHAEDQSWINVRTDVCMRTLQKWTSSAF